MTPIEHGFGRVAVVLLAMFGAWAPRASGGVEPPEPIAAVKAPFPVPAFSRPTFPDRVVSIVDHGGVPGGEVKNTVAIAAAVTTVAEAGGGRVLVPAGTWLTGPIHLRSNVELHLAEGAVLRFSDRMDDYLPAVFVRSGGVELFNYSPLIYARDCVNIAVTGPGLLDGNAEAWWPWHKQETRRGFEMGAAGVPVEDRVFGTPADAIRPSFVQFIGCRNVLLEGFTIGSGPNWTIHPVYCENVIIRRVNVVTDGPNNDGIDPDSCRNVLIEHCLFDTGDDCVVLKSGYDQDGRRVNRPTENVVMRHCSSKRGHGGLVIGSEMSGSVRNVFMHDCDFEGTDRVLRIKSRPGRGGVVENVWVENVTGRNLQREVVILNMDYSADRNPISDRFPPRFRNIHVRKLAATGAPVGIRIVGMENSPIEGLHFEDLAIVARQAVVARHARGLSFDRTALVSTEGKPWELDSVADITVDGSRIDRAEVGDAAYAGVVAADGSGTHTTVQAAIDAAPSDATAARPHLILVRPGRYQEHVVIPREKPFIRLLGLTGRAADTVISLGTNVKTPVPGDASGKLLSTPESATVLVEADDFTAADITFENTTTREDRVQALALFVRADRAAFRRCRFLGWQDTLRADTRSGEVNRQYFADCEITGHVDFIYAAGTAVFDRCRIHCRADGYITAASTPETSPFGYVFLDCIVTTGPDVERGVFLGRPWRPHAVTAFIRCDLQGQIRPEGWDNWGKPENEATVRYAEYKSTGPGAAPDRRVPWAKQLSDEEAKAYSVAKILGGSDGWSPAALELPLWSEPSLVPGIAAEATPGADNGTGRFWDVGIPGLYAYLPDAPAPPGGRMAIIACPGGGYTHLTRLLGADHAVAAFLPKDMAIISLRYRTTPPSTDIVADALADGQRAVRLVRHHAREWGIDPNRIGMVGWSAGANLVLNVASHHDAGQPDASDPVERASSRPDFVVMLSPWPAKRSIDDFPIPPSAPPALIGSADDDRTAPADFARGIGEAYAAAGVAHDLWILPTGGHGAFTIGAPGEGGRWIDRFLSWVERVAPPRP